MSVVAKLSKDFLNGFALPSSTKERPQRVSSKELITKWPSFINRGFAKRAYVNYLELKQAMKNNSKIKNNNFLTEKGKVKRVKSLNHLLATAEKSKPSAKKLVQEQPPAFIVPTEKTEALNLILELEDVEKLTLIQNAFKPTTKVHKSAKAKIESLSKN